MPVAPSVRTLVDAASGVPERLAAHAVELPVKALQGYATVRREGLGGALRPVLLQAATGAFHLSAAAASLPLSLVERLRHAGADGESHYGSYAAEAVAVGAPGVATEAADAAEEEASAAGVLAEVPAAADLPLEDFDHLTLGSLRSRMLRLSVDDLVVLRAYEQAHAERLAVLTMLENRIARLRRTSGE